MACVDETGTDGALAGVASLILISRKAGRCREIPCNRSLKPAPPNHGTPTSPVVVPTLNGAGLPLVMMFLNPGFR